MTDGPSVPFPSVRADAVERILVPFAGEGSGVAPLTWSQIGIWGAIVQSGESRTVQHTAELPPGTTVDDVADMVRFLMSRHQALRTRMLFDSDGQALQNCSEAGEAPLEIVEADIEDPASVAEEVSRHYQRKLFEYVTEWPLRTAVIRQHGVPTHLVMVVLHTAIDVYGLEVMLEDLASRDPETGAAPPVTGMQPLEQARREASPAGQRQNMSSLRYLERVMRSVPAQRFGPPKRDGQAEYRMITYWSPATRLAAEAVAARVGANTSAVLLASFAVAIARFTGINPVFVMLTVNNRFRPGLGNSVSKTSQISPFWIDLADLTLHEAVAVAGQSVINAYKNASYHPDQQDEVIELVERERGEPIDIDCFYNDRRMGDRGGDRGLAITDEEIRAALSSSATLWGDSIGLPQRKLYFNLDDPPGAMIFMMSADTRYFPPEDMERLVRDIEAVAVETALDGAASTGVRRAHDKACSLEAISTCHVTPSNGE